MTAQPTRDQLRALAARAADDGYTGNDNDGHLTVSPAVLTALLDQLDQAEARIKAAEELCDLPAEDTEDMDAISAHYASGYEMALQDIRRALEGGEDRDTSRGEPHVGQA